MAEEPEELDRLNDDGVEEVMTTFGFIPFTDEERELASGDIES